jgi:hypothetical protein
MSKVGSHDSFGHFKHKLWPKEGPSVKLVIWLPTTKSQESPKFLAWRWHATHQWKVLDEGYNFALDLISIRGLHTKLWGSKVIGVPILGILGLALESPKTKQHLGAGPVARHRVYYKEEGGGFPQVRVMLSLMCSCLLVIRLCTKVLQLRTNQLVVWFVQVRVSDWITCQSS